MSHARIQDTLNREEDIEKYCKNQAGLYAAARDMCTGGAITGAISIAAFPGAGAIPEAGLVVFGLGVAGTGFAIKTEIEYEKCVREETRKNRM